MLKNWENRKLLAGIVLLAFFVFAPHAAHVVFGGVEIAIHALLAKTIEHPIDHALGGVQRKFWQLLAFLLTFGIFASLIWWLLWQKLRGVWLFCKTRAAWALSVWRRRVTIWQESSLLMRAVFIGWACLFGVLPFLFL